METLFSLLENPLMQVLLIAGAGVGLSWLSERTEQRRVAAGLAYRPLKERVLEGMGFKERIFPLFESKVHKNVELESKEHQKAFLESDPWIQAAKELDLPIEKVMQLKQRVSGEPPKRKRGRPRKIQTNQQ